jgi:hypothetical protein
MLTVPHSDPNNVLDSLASLGLTEVVLQNAAMQGYFARANCTLHHPPTFHGVAAWGETVRSLRDCLAPMGWKYCDKRNYSRSISPDGNIAIVVAAGDEATGMEEGSPCTKSPKGPTTVDALEVNRTNQLCIPGLEISEPVSEDEEMNPTTWIFLIHHASDEIRSELSLPVEQGNGGRISVWKKRILLRPYLLDSDSIIIEPPDSPDIDISIKRKA